MPPDPPDSLYHIGLPAWAYPGWKGPYFPPDRPALESYAKVFNTVEGNTTFYGIPDARTVAGWEQAVAGTPLRFCFKLPRSVTHEARPSKADLSTFFKTISLLEANLGPFMIQLPATVGPEHLQDLERLIERCPRSFRYVIEVRHKAFFSEPERLEALIDEFNLGRVMLDSRPIYEGDRSHAEVLDALHEKPDVPVLDTVYNGVAFVRLILHPDIHSNPPWIEWWAKRVASYLDAGHQVFMMIHCPNNQHCPLLAETFHQTLRGMSPDVSVSALPPYPVPQQASLI